ncbi:ATP-dependent zinc metalloprotease FtsH [Flavobacteriaceae bacterium]|uniref:ATP-dependent zinc metalloprotease FtsH n=1 Tax=Candidatus Arcticimaribacter forsetii TaxID=2820661 RepID=UPI0020770943|nr:ATP-dependent zinc metalloprotease FtsH [Candidatus Arcticimaribacter forsetii]MDB2345508.1 ATP-dependent zinc metalloprotease FtsH [Flavobacteriaceae bacterium]MDB2457103.1 ATP-dependent zinc metalloprotease FtsH [Flavobacteriaceae bacterium]MDB4608662.1 ATP-dependent zinc metalloprotease FtsH [Flavobacteriaceae bacterium]MDB4643399.1 ATP-dependent zinc metalloprotease FtsH [Flavobacteriaceae bacterium]MDB4674866.1 ATP-dependent zinc metalloprotease FtsH [Flavobacteriaceae bacterium]
MAKENPIKKPKFNTYWVYGIVIVGLLAVSMIGDGSSQSLRKTNISEFESYLNAGDVAEVVVYNKNLAKVSLTETALDKQVHAIAKSKNLFGQENIKGPHYQFEVGNLELFQRKLEKAESNGIVFRYDFTTIENKWMDVFLSFLPILLIVGVWIFLMRRMSGGGGAGGGSQIFNIGKSKAKLFDEKTDIKTTFKDVAGLEGAKEEIQEIVDFLKNPQKYTVLGGKIPKGALLVGQPGTGKTLLAKAVAGEAKVPFFSLSGSDFVEMFVGVGASRVRDLFKQAKEKSPAIIFIDEIDAIGRARGKSNMTGSNDERENTLNQLLTEMDGFGTNTNVIVLAATNRADVLDKALMRAGRFDRQIYVDLPDVRERKEIFAVHIAPLKTTKTLDIDFLSKQTPGFSGADIANVCNEAALIAARKNKKSVGKQDFLDAVDRIVGGLEKKNKIITPGEKRTIAFHEAGHAMTSWFLEHAAPLVKVTIVPRGQSLGAAWYLPEERMIVRTEQMLDEMCATLGGRAAEKVVFNKISTGALSDLEKVTRQAKAMVTVYGLNEELGNITYYDSTGQSDYNFSKPYSEDTAQKIDKEISKLIEGQYERAIKLVKDNEDKLTTLAERLLEKEVLFKDDLLNILGERPFDKKDTEVEIEKEKKDESATE